MTPTPVARSARRDVLAAGGCGVGVERPDLHAADALDEQALRQLTRSLDRRLQVLVGPGRSPVGQPAVGVGGPVGRLERALVAPAVRGSRRRCCRSGPTPGSRRRAGRRGTCPTPGRGCPTARCRPPSCRASRRRCPGSRRTRRTARAQCWSTRAGSCPMRYGATVSCMWASTVAGPRQVSPSPVEPSSVCTCSQSICGCSSSRMVSIAVIFMPCSLPRSAEVRKSAEVETHDRGRLAAGCARHRTGRSTPSPRRVA